VVIVDGHGLYSSGASNDTLSDYSRKCYPLECLPIARFSNEYLCSQKFDHQKQGTIFDAMTASGLVICLGIN
jgi:hypothetical protein